MGRKVEVQRRAVLDPSLPFSMFQMYRLSSSMLPRALAQAMRTGRARGLSWGWGSRASWCEITSLLAGHLNGQSLHSSAVAATYSE